MPVRPFRRTSSGSANEFALLASSDYFNPRNLSVLGLLRRLGTNGVLRIGGNTSERTVWSGAGSPSQVDQLRDNAGGDRCARSAPAGAWLAAHLRPQSRARNAGGRRRRSRLCYQCRRTLPAGVSDQQRAGWLRALVGRASAKLQRLRLSCRVAALPCGNSCTPAGCAIRGACRRFRNRVDCPLRGGGAWQSGVVDSPLLRRRSGPRPAHQSAQAVGVGPSDQSYPCRAPADRPDTALAISHRRNEFDLCRRPPGCQRYPWREPVGPGAHVPGSPGPERPVSTFIRETPRPIRP